MLSKYPLRRLWLWVLIPLLACTPSESPAPKKERQVPKEIKKVPVPDPSATWKMAPPTPTSIPQTLKAIPGPDPASDPDTPVMTNACATCHVYPKPGEFTERTWAHAIPFVYRVLKTFHKGVPLLSQKKVAAYYRRYSARQVPSPTLYPSLPTAFGLEPLPIGLPRKGKPNRMIVDIIPSPKGAQLVDLLTGEILRVGSRSEAKVIGVGKHPVRARQLLGPKNVPQGYIVADLGIFRAADTQRGRLSWIDPAGKTHVLLETVGRVADFAVGDLNGDGHWDLVVAVFGWQKTGGLYLLLGTGDAGRYEQRRLSKRSGYISVDIADVDGDRRKDIIALTAQHWERIEKWSFEKGAYSPKVIFQAETPLWGAIGLRIVDLDLDGDMDIVHWNGDTLDSPKLAHFQGVHLLENRDGKFSARQLAELPGVHDVDIGDFDGDGRQDLVAVANLPPRIRETLVADGQATPQVPLEAVLLLSQKKKGQFIVNSLLRNHTCFSSVSFAHWEGGGKMDILLGGFGQGWSLLDHHGDAGSRVDGKAACHNDTFFRLSAGGTRSTGTKSLPGKKAALERQAASLERIVANDPDDARNRVNLGNVYMASNQFRRAERAFRDAIQTDPKERAAYVNLALVLDYTGRSGQAEGILQTILRTHADYADGHSQMAVVLYKQQKFALALEHIQTAVRLDEQSAVYHGNMGNILAALKRFKAAETAYLKALALDPKNPIAKQYLPRVRAMIRTGR